MGLGLPSSPQREEGHTLSHVLVCAVLRWRLPHTKMRRQPRWLLGMRRVSFSIFSNLIDVVVDDVSKDTDEHEDKKQINHVSEWSSEL